LGASVFLIGNKHCDQPRVATSPAWHKVFLVEPCFKYFVAVVEIESPVSVFATSSELGVSSRACASRVVWFAICLGRLKPVGERNSTKLKTIAIWQNKGGLQSVLWRSIILPTSQTVYEDQNY
jgi:hypothetical protein